MVVNFVSDHQRQCVRGLLKISFSENFMHSHKDILHQYFSVLGHQPLVLLTMGHVMDVFFGILSNFQKNLFVSKLTSNIFLHLSDSFKIKDFEKFFNYWWLFRDKDFLLVSILIGLLLAYQTLSPFPTGGCRTFAWELAVSRLHYQHRFDCSQRRINSFQPIFAFLIETSHLFCSTKQLTGFYMKCSTGMKWVNQSTFQKLRKKSGFFSHTVSKMT